MWHFGVYVESAITNSDLLLFLDSLGASVPPERVDDLSYPVESGSGQYVLLSLSDDPEAPNRLRHIAQATGKNLQSAITVSVGKKSYEFAITIAGKVIRHWNGGIVDLDDDVDAATQELARGQSVELWTGGVIEPLEAGES